MVLHPLPSTVLKVHALTPMGTTAKEPRVGLRKIEIILVDIESHVGLQKFSGTDFASESAYHRRQMNLVRHLSSIRMYGLSV